MLTPAELAEARAWIADCTWRDLDTEDDVDRLTNEEVEAGIIRHYHDGLEGFRRDGVPQ
jgi:hypothetical protein